ncbi:hypothetical protein SteCoe_32606 [Stentor coeruleus]|uniref:Sm domain-containing protein n=1 Tax=Stentor coeruleus TaxID=5963 RepID=A0A1R2AYP0_9CILI|nr:hypothetical protein SteCoe_32606 [Stentor coeruleus]
MSASLPYIGSQISLISKSDIRYEGTLSSIDTSQHTVSLANVRSFGTEGRRGDGREIPASTEIYEIIIFRGADIKDLTVIQSTPAPPEPVQKQEVTPKPEPIERRRPQRRFNRYQGRNYGELHQNPDEKLKETLKEDFDFDAAKLQRSVSNQDLEKKYDKTAGFFDNLTTNDRDDYDRYKQKAMDRETFGEESVYMAERDLRRYNNRRGRGFRRGRRPRS